MLETISFSENDFLHESVSRKIVCTSDMHSTFDTNAGSILKILIDNLRKNSLCRVKPKRKFSEIVTYVLLSFRKDRCLK